MNNFYEIKRLKKKIDTNTASDNEKKMYKLLWEHYCYLIGEEKLRMLISNRK